MGLNMKAPDKRLQVKIDELCDLMPNGHLASTLGMEVFIDHIIELIKDYKNEYIRKDEVIKMIEYLEDQVKSAINMVSPEIDGALLACKRIKDYIINLEDK